MSSLPHPDLQHSAVVVIDMANDFVYPGGVIADAGGPDYQQRDPAFERALAERGITRLYVTGLHTDCCARHASGDAFQRGYDLVWVTDGLQAFTDDAHRAGLEYFKAWYATDPARQLRTVDELVEEWSGVGEPIAA